MPKIPKRPCAHGGCNEFVAGKYCEEHTPKKANVTRSANGKKWHKMYTYRWSLYSKRRLREYPWCESCKKSGVMELATITDHIVPHKGDDRMFWDKNNHQSLCTHCHAVKTATEDGAFGNKKRDTPTKTKF